MFQLSLWEATVVALVLIHMSIMCVTLYLHRSQTHGGVLFHPVVSHVMRFWLWLTTGTVTREWVPVHLEHHEAPDKPGDPHSPRVHGKVMALFFAHVLYRRAARDPAILAKFEDRVPSDWVEMKLYAKHSWLGILLLFCVQFILFGFIGVIIWFSQLAALLVGTTIINGFGHLTGYRNYPSQDNDARNLFPIDFILGGEALHDNHHAALRSPKLSRRWFEFDIGWAYIQCLRVLGLARLQKIGDSRSW